MISSHIHNVNAGHKVVSYSIKTTTGVIRRHLFKEHKEVWFDACKKFGFEVSGDEYKLAYTQYFSLPQKQPSSEESRPKFTPEGFVDALTEFIVGDDLVCILFEFFYNKLTEYVLASQYCRISPVTQDFSDASGPA